MERKISKSVKDGDSMETRNLCSRCADDYRTAGYLLTLVSAVREWCDFCDYRLGPEYEVREC